MKLLCQENTKILTEKKVKICLRTLLSQGSPQSNFSVLLREWRERQAGQILFTNVQ